MCGLAGILTRSPDRPSRDLLSGMADAIAHRGPDAFGHWAAPHVGLAHRRLAIIDLQGGDQPIANEDESIQIVFNGEIYNYQALKTDLQSRGHTFRTNSDTEVVVHLYEEFGSNLVHQLRGMFAFALWDGKRQQLLLARDHVGQKPLYVYRDSHRLAFASEIKSILTLPGLDLTLDPRAIDAYFTYGCIPGELSIYANIKKLPAAHTLTVRPDAFDADPARYWSLDFTPDEKTSVAEWCDRIREKVDETIEAHRIADVPVGAFLSGGLDSSLIVASMARMANTPLKTFSIGFHEEKFSELPFARQVANHFGTEHIEHIVTPEAVRSLEDLVYFYDEPFADSSAIPSMAVAKLAAEHVKVVISGDGGDEAFGGYARYRHDLREASIRRHLPSALRERVLSPLGAHWPKSDRLPRPFRLKTALQNLALDPAAAYANTLAIMRPPMRRALLQEELQVILNGHLAEERARCLYHAPEDDPLRGMLAVDVALLLPDDFLTKVDRASMARGLEVRPPFVDHELLALCATIPSQYKIRNGETKWILKQALGDRLPPGLLNRPKQGFEIPINDWFRGPLRDAFHSLVLDPLTPIAKIINTEAVRKLYQSHLGGQAQLGPQLWSLMVLGRWLAEYSHGGLKA